jgi:hypothetical protein
VTLRTELKEVRGIAVKRKEEYEGLQAANDNNIPALQKEVKDLTESLRLENEERKTTDIGVCVPAEKAANDRNENKEEQKRAAQQMEVVEGRKTEIGEMLRKMEEKDVKTAKERNDEIARVEQKLSQQLEDLRSKVEEWEKGETTVRTVKQTANRDRSITTSNGVVESNDVMWEGASADGDKYLIFTDSKEGWNHSGYHKAAHA